MRKRIYIYSLFALMSAVLCTGQDLSGISGVFTDPGFGSRPSAMGGAFTAISNDIHAVMYNPAGLCGLEKKEALFSYRDQLGLIGYNYLAASMPIDKISAAGIGLVVSGDKALREYTFSASYSRKFSLINAGVSLKLRYASFGNNSLSESEYIIFEPDEIAAGRLDQVKGDALGFGIDAGILAKITDDFMLGVVYRDIAAPVYWNSHNENTDNPAKGKYTESIPSQLLIGASYGVMSQTLIAADFLPALSRDTDHRLKAGIESVLFNIVALRGGMQTFFNSLKDEKYSLGIGIKIELNKDLIVKTDYTYQLEDLADSQIISVGLEF